MDRGCGWKMEGCGAWVEDGGMRYGVWQGCAEGCKTGAARYGCGGVLCTKHGAGFVQSMLCRCGLIYRKFRVEGSADGGDNAG